MSINNGLDKEYRRTKYSCYYTYLAMSSVFSLPPLLFVTFREMYGISYTLLGTLVLVNFFTQLAVDLIFTFFTRYFNIRRTIKIMPLITTLGLLIYASVPMLFPKYAYIGLLCGTVVFSVAAGLCEVLMSPLVAAIPSDNPSRDMSLLHSLYAYGVLTVVLLSTAFLRIFGSENWMYLTFFWAALPIGSFILFSTSKIPDVNISESKEKGRTDGRRQILTLCVICIFLGSAAENTMTNWVSGYIENALHIPKVAGDILGMAAFAVLLGIGRTLHAKYGGNISTILLCGMAGAAACYIVVGLTQKVVISMIACVLTGLCTSMLWPGTLILMEEKLPAAGVTAYALMASGGDLGGAVAPQLLGIVVDTVKESSLATHLGNRFSLTAEQIGMRAGMLLAALFPILGALLLLCGKRILKKYGSDSYGK